MKTLETNFVENADKLGKNNFVQLRKALNVKVDGQLKNMALYRRDTLEGKLVGFEVFTFKVIKEGTPMQGGGTVKEDYEQYPRKSAFGHTAWFVGGENAEERALTRYESLMTGKIVAVEVEGEEEEISVPVVRVTSTAPIKEGLKLPEKPFSQKELAAFNGIENYKQVYSDLQKMLARGILKHGEKRESIRGKSAQLFVRV
jgi:autonomous glycyl radical cofactor GrcA